MEPRRSEDGRYDTNHSRDGDPRVKHDHLRSRVGHREHSSNDETIRSRLRHTVGSVYLLQSVPWHKGLLRNGPGHAESQETRLRAKARNTDPAGQVLA